MKRNILEVYSLVVCFVTLCCFVIYLGIGIYDVIETINPEFTMSSYDFERHQTNEAYLKSLSNCDDKLKELNDDEIKEKREFSYNLQLKTEKREGFQSLIQVIIIIFIDFVVFLIHWKMAKHARATNMT